MSASVKETVWLTRDNVIEWVLYSDGVPLTSLAGLTRVVICSPQWLVDSSVAGSTVIWWTDSVTNKELPDGTLFSGDVLKLKLGGELKTETPGTYNCELIVYDAGTPNGRTIPASIVIELISGCVP